MPCGVLRVGEGRGEVSVQSAVLDEVQVETEVREALVGADQVLLQLANTGLFLQSWNSGKRQCQGLSAIMEQWETSVVVSFCNHGTVGDVSGSVFL